MTPDSDDNLTPELPDESEAGAADTPLSDLEARLGKAEAELAETKDRFLRALAEAENQRRRLTRERDDAGKYGASSFAKDLLDVADNLSRALASAGEGEGGERTKGLVEGVAATERALLAAFERHGISRIEPQPGERFDHNFHQAMFEIENSGQPAGAVVQVLQAGYRMRDRLLRPALVGVAKSGG